MYFKLNLLHKNRFSFFRILEDNFIDSNVPVIQKRIDDFEECGLSADRVLTKRIIGGNEAKFGQFPWQAFIKIASYQCGGVLGEKLLFSNLNKLS